MNETLACSFGIHVDRRSNCEAKAKKARPVWWFILRWCFGPSCLLSVGTSYYRCMTQFFKSIVLSDNVMISYFAAFKSKPVSPNCFVLPAQTKLLLQDIKEGRSQSFTLKSLESVATPFQNWGHTANSASEKMYVLIYCFKSNFFFQFLSSVNRIKVKRWIFSLKTSS